jgi:GST-like protein
VSSLPLQNTKPALPADYKPPAVWVKDDDSGTFGKLNRPVSGATHEKVLPIGEHPYQVYSLGTPNGVKVTALLEELGVEYDAWRISIIEGDQFGSGFVALNPNSKIPGSEFCSMLLNSNLLNFKTDAQHLL